MFLPAGFLAGRSLAAHCACVIRMFSCCHRVAHACQRVPMNIYVGTNEYLRGQRLPINRRSVFTTLQSGLRDQLININKLDNKIASLRGKQPITRLLPREESCTVAILGLDREL